MRGPAVVIGSVHIDLIGSAARLPGPGESVTGGVFTMAPGGKCGNQAIQLALNDIETTVVARVGDDQFGRFLLSALQCKGVKTNRIVVDPDFATGASTVLSAAGDYCSIIAPGAAARLTRADLDAARQAIETAGAVVMQRELPDHLIAMVIDHCRSLGKPIVFNASPVMNGSRAFSARHWEAIDWLVVNRIEARALAGISDDRSIGIDDVARTLRADLGVANVVITLGGDGAYWDGTTGSAHQPALSVTVVDAVGAGDAFLGTLLAGLLHGDSIADSLRRGAVAGAIAVGRAGAYDAHPTRAEIDRAVRSMQGFSGES